MQKASPVGTRPSASVGNHSAWAWMGVALLAHTGWGLYPVVARYLQTISHIPSMALLSFANLLAVMLLLPFIRHELNPRYLRSGALWLLALIVVLRAITNLLAARYTHAIYVQLITLMTPLLVAVMSAGFFGETLPRFTIPAIGLSLIGALLMMSGDISSGGVAFTFGPSDWLGIGLAITSTLCLTSYMMLVPRTMKAAVPGNVVLFVQLTSLMVTSGVISLIMHEDWGHYLSLGWNDWALFLIFAFGVQLGGNLGQIASLRRLGGPLVSSMMAWRLISTLAMAALLLGERLASIWQTLGAIIVLITITTYLWQQRRV